MTMLRKKYKDRVNWKENRVQMRAMKKHMGIFEMKRQFWFILYHKSLLNKFITFALAVTNSWFLCKQDAISNKIPLKIKMDRLKFKLEIVEELSAFPFTNKSILTDDEDNSVVIPLVKISKRYNSPAIHVMAFILANPG
ncbi:uncharacterized protein TNCV_1334551 [Trichonephila clavipes]|nr:uncharacterized protein TNCV_1334551 [Trichonephila clavipes]